MDKLRDFLKSWPGRILLVLCLAPVALLGLESYFHQGAMTHDQVARVGDRTLTVFELQNEINARRNELVQEVDASRIDEAALSRQMLELMVNRALVEEQAKSLGMQVSDMTITQMLQNDPLFQDANGQFSNDLFAMFLQNNRLTKDRLFDLQRSQINTRQLMTGILQAVIYPESQISRLLDLQLESRNVWLKRLPWQDYASQVAVNDAEIGEYYATHKDELFAPEMVDLRYIELPTSAINVPAPTDDELKLAYQQYLQSRGMGDIELSQILLTDDDAKEQAVKLKSRIDSGENFEILAKQHSDDPSGQTGGQIGLYNPAVFGDDASAVTSAITALGVGEVSEPVATQYGTHLFKVTKTGSSPSFDSLKAELTQTVQEQKQQALFAERVAMVNNMVADGFGIEDIASQMNFEIKQLPNYQHNNPIMGQPAISRAAFNEFTIQDGSVSANIDLEGSTLWVAPSNYRPKTAMTLEMAKDTIKDTLTVQKASQLAYEDAKTKLDTYELSEFTPLGAVSRQSDFLNASELSSLFSHTAPSGETTRWAVIGDEGASVLVGGEIYNDVQSQLTDSQRKAAKARILGVAGQDYLEDYVHYLRQVHKVEINDEVLKTL